MQLEILLLCLLSSWLCVFWVPLVVAGVDWARMLHHRVPREVLSVQMSWLSEMFACDANGIQVQRFVSWSRNKAKLSEENWNNPKRTFSDSTTHLTMKSICTVIGCLPTSSIDTLLCPQLKVISPLFCEIPSAIYQRTSLLSFFLLTVIKFLLSSDS